MNVDLNRIRPRKTAVQAFDGSRWEGRCFCTATTSPAQTSGRADRGSAAPLKSRNTSTGGNSAFAPPVTISSKPAGATISTASLRTIGGSTGALQSPPLSHFFPGPSHTIGGTLHGPSSDSDDTPTAPSAVYAVTEEIPAGVHIRLVQENEELNNWTSVSRYSAVIANV
ncbi:hypothetical protein CRG98_015613 [Punica granatum]|uniref:Uncharacterized protein n=1 Tax=Punica granatum TaxID=22663 RepID=A0A2I0K757_PUNGR|nr:hypothetical protein CRG98_015613 [Punica granatum]